MPVQRALRRRRGILSVIGMLAAAGTFGCAGNKATDSRRTADDRLPLGGYGTVVVVSRGGLVQTLRLSKHVLSRGDAFYVESVLSNRGPGPVQAWLGYTCRLDITETALVGREGCLPPTGPFALSPGDSVLGAERWVVGSPPGQYRFAVRQTVDTSLVASITLVVR